MVDAPRVLLLDGRPERRMIMRIVVETGDRGAKVVAEAFTAEEAVAAVGRYEVDAAVVEIQLPVAVGLAAIAELRAAHPSLLIVVCSFLGDLSTQLQAAMAGADAYLTKPVSARELHAVLRTAAPSAGRQLVTAT